MADVNENLEKWPQKGSNWIFDWVLNLWISFVKYQAIKGGCCYFEIPKKLKLKHAIINVKRNCKDKWRRDCVRRPIRAILYSTKYRGDRPSSYQNNEHDGLNFDELEFPAQISEFPKLEKQNWLAINIYGWNDKTCVFVHRLSKKPGYMTGINLM